MSFLDVIDTFVPNDFPLTDKTFINVYRKSLELLNKLKLSRFNAVYFGSMQLGPELYSWKNKKDFIKSYNSVCIYVMDDLYNRLKEDKQALIETTLCLFYSILSIYIENTHDKLPKDIQELLKENDKYRSNLEEEFK